MKTSVVGKAGFEPATSASRTLRANQAALLPVSCVFMDDETSGLDSFYMTQRSVCAALRHETAGTPSYAQAPWLPGLHGRPRRLPPRPSGGLPYAIRSVAIRRCDLPLDRHYLADPPTVHLCNLELPRTDGGALTLIGNMSEDVEKVATEGDVLPTRYRQLHLRADVVEAACAVDQPSPIVDTSNLGLFILVQLVVHIADELGDYVACSHHASDASVLVDDYSECPSAGAHLCQEVQGKTGLRDKMGLPEPSGYLKSGWRCGWIIGTPPTAEEILQEQNTRQPVKILVVDGKAYMPRGLDRKSNSCCGDRNRQANYVHPWSHHLAHDRTLQLCQRCEHASLFCSGLRWLRLGDKAV